MVCLPNELESLLTAKAKVYLSMSQLANREKLNEARSEELREREKFRIEAIPPHIFPTVDAIVTRLREVLDENDRRNATIVAIWNAERASVTITVTDLSPHYSFAFEEFSIEAIEDGFINLIQNQLTRLMWKLGTRTDCNIWGLERIRWPSTHNPY